MRKMLGSTTPTSFSNPQRNFGAPSLEFSSKAQSKLEAKHPTHSQQKKNPKAPRPWFFFASQNVGQGRTTYIPATKMKTQT
jgi:hypothetical protein